jgi:hypothetical protein
LSAPTPSFIVPGRFFALAPLLWFIAAPAHAEDARAVHLSWVRSAGAHECGDAARVQADVVRRLGKNPFREPSQLFVEASVSGHSGAFTAQLELMDAGGGSLGSRQVSSDAASCASLVSAAGLAIALMIEPDAAITPHLVPSNPPTPTPAPAPVRSPLRAVKAAPQLTFFAAGIVAARVLPQAAFGARLGAELRLPGAWRSELSLSFLPERRQELNGIDTGFGLTYASLGICYEPLSAARVTLAACALAQLGAMNVTAYEPARSRDGELAWSAGAVGLRAGWVLAEPLLLRVGVEGSLPLVRREYAVAGSSESTQPVFRDPAFAATLHAGLALRF